MMRRLWKQSVLLAALPVLGAAGCSEDDASLVAPIVRPGLETHVLDRSLLYLDAGRTPVLHPEIVA